MPHTERGTKTDKETQACSNDKHKHKYKQASTDIRPTQRSVASNMLSPAHTETLDIIFLHLEIYSSVAHQIPAVAVLEITV